MLTSDQLIHIVVILLGASAAAATYLGAPMVAGVITIFITAVGAIGAYTSPSAPAPTPPV